MENLFVENSGINVCFFVFQNDDDGSDFDLPPSWVSPIEISLKGNKVACLLGRTMGNRKGTSCFQNDKTDDSFFSILEFQTRCPYGKKTKLYKKAKIEKLAEYLLKDGLVSSLSSYNDYECEYPGFKRFFLLIFFFAFL